MNRPGNSSRPTTRLVGGFTGAFARSRSAWLLFLLVLLGPGSARALPALALPGERPSARSSSGQFIVYGLRRAGETAPVSRLETNRSLIRLDLALVPVSCERIKQALYRELAAPLTFRGKLYLVLYPTRTGNDPIRIESTQFADGRHYRMELPELVDRSRYVESIVQLLLLEMANRKAVERTADIPAWLIEGLTQQVLVANETQILLAPPQPGANGIGFTPFMTNAVSRHPLEEAHLKLCQQPPLTFDELSWPAPESVGGAAGEHFRLSAQLFVYQLAQLKDGRACLRAMLDDLPQHYNWQFAFLNAFNACFSRPLDVEKWWALQSVHFTGRELAQNWAPEDSWAKLQQIVQSPVDVRAGNGELPLRAEVALQAIVRDWESARQTLALEGKLRELAGLRLRVSPEFVPLVDEYHQTLLNYLQNRDRGGLRLLFRKHAVLRHNVDETVQRLDELDRKRLDLRPAPRPENAPKSPAETARSP